MQENTDTTDVLWFARSHGAHDLLGRVALRRGNVAEAKRHLLAAARAPRGLVGGPDHHLARELLEAGEREVVLEYLALLVRNFGPGVPAFARARYEDWVVEILTGRIPRDVEWS